MSNEPTSFSPDERLMGALAHIGVVVPYAGVLVPLTIWLTQRKKSAFVEIQGLQALLYMLFLTILPFVLWPPLVIMPIFTTQAMALFDNSGTSGAPTGINWFIMIILFVLPFALAVLVLLFLLALVIYGLIGAAVTYSGRDFRYPVFGRIAQRFASQGRPMGQS